MITTWSWKQFPVHMQLKQYIGHHVNLSPQRKYRPLRIPINYVVRTTLPYSSAQNPTFQVWSVTFELLHWFRNTQDFVFHNWYPTAGPNRHILSGTHSCHTYIESYQGIHNHLNSCYICVMLCVVISYNVTYSHLVGSIANWLPLLSLMLHSVPFIFPLRFYLYIFIYV